MQKRKKLWRSLRTLTVVGASGLAGCAATSADAKREGYSDSASSQADAEGESEGESESEGEGESEGATRAEGEGEGESEGEGEGESEGEGEGESEGEGEGESEGEGEGESEGEGKTASSLASNDLDYLKHLGLVRGHLFVGYELFKAGHVAAAKTHMKHPKSELYADIAPAFKARGTGGFAEQLEALAVAVETERDRATVDKAYAGIEAAIAENENPALKANKAPAARIKLAAALVRVAAEEYAIAVVDGKTQNAHEYQDAWGFTTVARRVVASLDDSVSAKTEAATLLDGLLGRLWPGLIPPKTLDTNAAELFGAAAKLDILAAGQ